MNSKHPSAERICWTTTSLNFSLPIQQSLHTLANSTEKAFKHYEEGTLADSQHLLAHIELKLSSILAESTKTRNFNSSFWNTDLDENSLECPSVRMNEAFGNVTDYVRRHLSSIVHEFNNGDIIDVVADDSDNDIDIFDIVN